MSEKLHIDPLAEGFFADESLELAERVGLALKEAAKYMDITYGEHVLATACATTEHGGARFNFSECMAYDFDNDEKRIAAHPEAEAEIREYSKKFRAYCTEAHNQLRSPEHVRFTDSKAEWAGGWGGHSNPDFGRIVNIGTIGVRKIISECRAKNNPDSDWFYNACEYAMDAVDILGERFYELAVKMEAECDDPVKKAQYAAAKKAFSVVPKNPAYDFTSACQVFWMLYTFDGIDSPGRFDQYMARAYNATEDKAEVWDVLGRLWDCFHDVRAWNLCLSGSDEKFVDQSNGLTYDILKMAREKKYQTPNITLRVHRNTPDKLWNAIADTLATGIGMPALYNDEVVCPALEQIGIPPHDSHEYCMNGCNQIDIMGKSHMGLEDGEVILAKCLEYALHNGVNGMTGELESVETGDARTFTTYQQVENAFMRQLDYVTYVCCVSANASQQRRATYAPNPFRSCLIEGCLEKGVDFRNGGPLYNHGQILAESIADTGDSLYALKKLVFDEKKYTMAELIDALNANFEGYDQMRHDFASCEKFGNDIEAVDTITARVLNRFFTILKRHNTYRGGRFTGGCSTFNRSTGYGRNIAALPNGRLKGDPLIADSIGATPGSDVHGPTALINSVLKYNHKESASGLVFQIKFDKKMFETEKGKESFIALAKTYFAGGGQQYTVTVVSADELRDAKLHPEKHRDLIVRVGGYSDYFVDLDEGLQDSVIARTDYSL